MRKFAAFCIAVLAGFGIERGTAASPPTVAFAKAPVVFDPEISPDGRFISFIAVIEGLNVALVGTVATGQSKLVLASDRDRFDVQDCMWAKAERLLCSFRGITAIDGVKFPTSRMVAVNPDGSDMRVLVQNRGQIGASQFQDDVIDLLPDHPTDILIRARSGSGMNYAVYSLDVMTGDTRRQTRETELALAFATDNAGNIRLRMRIDDEYQIWEHRAPNENRWTLMHKYRPGTDPDFTPIGFTDDHQFLYVLQPLDGRQALWRIDPSGVQKPEIAYANPRYDVTGTVQFPPRFSILAATYADEKRQLHFFDDRFKAIVERINRQLPDATNVVQSQNWDGTLMTVASFSDVKAPEYFIYSTRADRLSPFGSEYPDLKNVVLSKTQPIALRARDGATIPAYLTMPHDKPARDLPLVVLTASSLSGREIWGFDWLAQFFAARGYAVIQPNHRGSGGYGAAWEMGNSIRAWSTAVADVADSARDLAAQGLIDPDRVCIVGRSFGGYLALMSSIVENATYRCAVAISAPSDWGDFVRDFRITVARSQVRDMVGTDDVVRDQGSAVKRANEVALPILLFHGDDDVTIRVDHSRDMAKALQRAGKSVEYTEYKNVEHSLLKTEYRVDMLDKIDAFLAQHIGR